MPYKDPIKRAEYQTQYMKRYLKNPEARQKHKIRVARNDAKTRKQIDVILAEFRKNGCSKCLEKDPVCIDAHHLDPTEKDFTLADARGRKLSPTKVKEELEKCIPVCANCHRKIHANMSR